MFGDNRPNLETFLFDFSGDLYGATLSVALLAFLRPEQAFASVEALVTRMQADCTAARAVLADTPPDDTAGTTAPLSFR
jgi:riboflavin kinase/FMN adenylyltransferase